MKFTAYYDTLKSLKRKDACKKALKPERHKPISAREDRVAPTTQPQIKPTDICAGVPSTTRERSEEGDSTAAMAEKLDENGQAPN